jgi:hypothetical protein
VGASGQVALTWSGTSGTTYSILRGGSSGGESAIGTSASSSYTDTGLTNGTKYWYIVKAVNGTGNACASANSNEISATPNNCTVFSTADTSADRIPDTTGSFCFVVCWDIQGLQLSNMEGRTFTINGTTMNCPNDQQCSLSSNPLPTKDRGSYATSGAYMFQVSACPGTGNCHDYATLNWWGTGHDCQ